MRHRVKVILWDEEIGTLTSDSSSCQTYFYFTDRLSQTARSAFPFGFSEAMLGGRLPIPAEDRAPYNGTPPFISDSLPDAWGNELFEQWRTANRISKNQITPCDKLAFIGTRGMGALEFRPEEKIALKTDPVDIGAIAQLADKILQEREDAVLSPDEEPTLHSLIAIGSSVGGRQAKALLAIERESGEIRSGQIANLPSHDYCIIKFNIPGRDTSEIEYLYYRLATASGIEMTASSLQSVEGIKHFLTHRFDRDELGHKIHVQTLAAINPKANSYEDILATCRGLNLSYKEQEQVFLRMVFNILANNTDDHTRNFSFLMTRNGNWSFSPAYDITFIFDQGGWRGNREHCLSVAGHRVEISKDDILQFAQDNNIREPEKLIEQVAAVLRKFNEFAKDSGVRQEYIARMNDTINANLEYWGLAAPAAKCSFTTDDGDEVADTHLEMAYRSGNFHLLAEINGKPVKFVINKSNEAYNQLLKQGIRSFDENSLRQLVLKCMF